MGIHNNSLIGSSGQQGYQISRSVRLRSSASAYLNRTLTTPTSAKAWTFSAWIKRGKLGTAQSIFISTLGGAGVPQASSYFTTNDTIQVYDYNGAAYTFDVTTSQVFRDPSAWYHLIFVYDSANATASNRARLYVNGIQITAFSSATYPTLNTDSGAFNRAYTHYLSQSNAQYFDGYMTEINFIDGQALTPSSFGETNAITGVWQPKKYAGTYGTNGFYLNFSDNSAATAAAIGKDYSGNGNNWTPNIISVTAGVTYDSMLDVPTPYADGGTGRGNYAVGNPLAVNVTTSATATLTNGNLLLTNGSATYSGFPSTMSIPVTGKWAWKFKVTGSVSGSNEGYIGFACNSSGNPVTGASSGAAANWFTTVQVQAVSDRGVVHKYAGGGVVTDAAGSGGTGATGDEWEFLIDRDAGTTIVKINGTIKATVTGLPATQELFPFATFYQTSGYFIFDYTPSDTSYKTLNTQNLPASTIFNGAGYMAATTYTGTGATQSISNAVNGVSFQPDFVWFKSRATTYAHALFDSVRGVTKGLASNDTATEFTSTAGNDLSAFTSTGFTVGAPQNWNAPNNASSNPVAWQWNAGGSTVTNTSGSISAQVRANPTAGFAVVTYTGNGTQPSTVGHGLGVAPSMVILKTRNSASYDWNSYHISLGNTQYIALNTTAAAASAVSLWNNTTPTSTVFTVNHVAVNTSSNTYVAYCFAAVAGYSAFGSYTGNGSADGPFVYTGFRPRFVMCKSTTSADNWFMFDTSRDTYNVVQKDLYPNLTLAESPGVTRMDITSNGFKCRTTANPNLAQTYIYMAFAENPFKNSLAR